MCCMPFDGCLDLRILLEADLEICCGVVNDSWGRSVLLIHKEWARLGSQFLAH